MRKIRIAAFLFIVVGLTAAMGASGDVRSHPLSEIVVDTTSVITDLNADKVDGEEGSYYLNDTDTNAQTVCSGQQYLAGDGDCKSTGGIAEVTKNWNSGTGSCTTSWCVAHSISVDVKEGGILTYASFDKLWGEVDQGYCQAKVGLRVKSAGTKKWVFKGGWTSYADSTGSCAGDEPFAKKTNVGEGNAMIVSDGTVDVQLMAKAKDASCMNCYGRLTMKNVTVTAMTLE